MPKWFNTAGPCQPDIHYMLPPLQRFPGITRIIDQRGYFVIHAPRQTGKTTAMLALAKALTDSEKYAAIMVSAEVGQPFSHNPGKAERAILDAWRGAAQFDLPEELQPPPWPAAEDGRQIGAALQTWSKVCPRPLVVLIDEIDSLMDDALMAILRQLRDGYPRRPQRFPHSLALIGMRDVRDYKVRALPINKVPGVGWAKDDRTCPSKSLADGHTFVLPILRRIGILFSSRSLTSGGQTRLQTASPFNIKVKSLTLSNFTQTDVHQLYQQHTDATGQPFTPEAIATVTA